MHILIDKVIKKYLDHSSLVKKNNQKTHLTFTTLNYHISTTFCTVLKMLFQNFANNFVKKILKF